MDAEMLESRIVKIAEDRGSAGVLHGMHVLGLLPQCCFGPVAVAARLAADEVGWARAACAEPVLQRKSILD